MRTKLKSNTDSIHRAGVSPATDIDAYLVKLNEIAYWQDVTHHIAYKPYIVASTYFRIRRSIGQS